MGKGLPRTQKHMPLTRAPVVKQTIPLKNLALSFTGASGVGFATAVLGDFPEGNILFLAAVAYISFRKRTDATGVQDTFDGDYSIGTTPTADNALAGTEVNIVPSTAMGAATAGVGPIARGASTAHAVLFDNTDGSLELNLNVLIDDANISADAQAMLANGQLHIAYIVLGDD